MRATVLFADISGTARLAEIGGEDIALKALAKCLQRLARAAESAGGKVVRTVGEGVMVVFPTPDAAACGSAAMHATIDALPAVNDLKLGVHVGFHSGPVIEYNDDVLGDTVKFAARLLEAARKGETLTSRQTAATLRATGFRCVPRDESIGLREGRQLVEVCELVADDGAPPPRPPRRRPVAVQLACGEQRVSVSRELETAVIGREHGCGLVVTDRMASRRHCVVKLHEGAFVLEDHSSNGTLVCIAGCEPLLLARKAIVLQGHGELVFGPQRFTDSKPVHFRCV